ncbi:hypothetical protein R3W88_004213 [Solanum pinnatisectum]|uniref:glyceraldehyde-3-phosphate dehydrogenase (NADP(+)) (phosphorylating) n=1 Tax=Solanum pinnatisectum TaxID=50273 RepID=A0AAV9KB15_9SOLN|nr:hypothetical protein R3W88_004213 [Solanum pinnatisectum]
MFNTNINLPGILVLTWSLKVPEFLSIERVLASISKLELRKSSSLPSKRVILLPMSSVSMQTCTALMSPSSAMLLAPPIVLLLLSKSLTKNLVTYSKERETIAKVEFRKLINFVCIGIIKGTMTTTHSYNGDQRLLDASHRDLRRARAAALNIVPTSTGAAKAVALVLPSLKGKLNGIAMCVPTPNVSVVDLVVQVSKKTFAEEVNAAFRESADKELAGILSVCNVPLVSFNFWCSDVSSTVDSSLTMVMGDDMVKVIAWYDNEWGYSQRVVDLADIVANQWI